MIQPQKCFEVGGSWLESWLHVTRSLDQLCVFLVFENLATSNGWTMLLESKARSSLLTYAAVGDGSSPHFDLATWTAGARKVVKIQIFNTALIECEDECPFHKNTPGRWTWNIVFVALGRSCFFLNGWSVGSILIFQGVFLRCMLTTRTPYHLPQFLPR